MRQNRTKLLGIAAVLFIAQGVLNLGYLKPMWMKNYAPKQATAVEGLSPDQLLAALAGFREMIAGILWVRADSFFDNGNYDAILPIIQLVTILDPHQIDVFATGMWHIAYNFTDEEQRSDRRYIPSALALGKKGSKLNPETYEMFFETGWLWFHKVDDNYDQAVKWFKLAAEKPDMMEARKNLLATAYQRNGEIEKGLQRWYELYDAANKAYQNHEETFGLFQQKETIENNIDTMLVRMSQRGYFGNKQGIKASVPYDTDNPFDVGFSARVTVEDSRILRIEGTWNVLPVGTRIRVILRDADYPRATPAGMDWDFSDDVNLDPPKDITFMQDQLYVKNRRFDKRIDMSKDPTMYPFRAENYLVEFYYNPRSAPPHIQDKFGWNGEGMTDPNFLNTSIRPGQRVMYTTLKLNRDQILLRGEWVDRHPVVQTANFKAPDRTNSEKDLIEVPGLLNEAGK